MNTPDQLRLKAEPSKPAGGSYVEVLNHHIDSGGIVQYRFPIDHFGVVADGILRELMTKNTMRRQRKVAFNSLVRTCKAVRQIHKSFQPRDVGLMVTPGGDLVITLIGWQEKLDE